MASSGSRSGGSSYSVHEYGSKGVILEEARKKRSLEKEKSKKKEQRDIGIKQPEENYKEQEKTCPGHEASGAGAGGGNGGNGDRGGDHYNGKPKKPGYTFCLLCQEYIRSGPPFEQHVRIIHRGA